MGQITFSIVFLFAFRERECCPAFRAGDFKVWHDAFLHQAGLEVVLPRLLSERWAQAASRNGLVGRSLLSATP